MMTWDYPYRLGGPVLAWELHLGRRNWAVRLVTVLFFGLCVTHFAVTTIAFESRPQLGQEHYLSKQAWMQSVNESKFVFCAQLLGRYFPLQMLVLLLMTPILTAGALGQEKEKDTLIALFGTELADREIVWGKVLGRFSQLCGFILFSLPLMMILAGFARVSLINIGLCYLHTLVITFTMTGICIFSAVITRRTRDAIMACYSIIIIIALISLTILGDRPLPTWLNPVEVTIGLSAYPFTNIQSTTLMTHLLFFAILGYVFVKLSCWMIRWAGLRQLEERSMRWRWVVRTNIGDDPFRWRERHFLGVAPLPALRMIPTWLGAMGCLAFSISMILGIVNNLTHGRLMQSVFSGQWDTVVQIFQRLNQNSIHGEVILMGVMLIIFAGGTILIRSAGSIAEEKRLKTWDDLLMTGTRIDSMASSKMWGILQASVLFVLCYSLPYFLFSILGGAGSLAVASICFVINWLVMYGAAEIGMGISLSNAEKEAVHRR